MNDLVVTHREALEVLEKQDTPEAKAILDYVRQIEKKNIVVLGTDEAFVLTDKNGQIKAFKSAVTLSKKGGTLVQPMFNGDLVVSAQGYEVITTAAGASTIFPKTVMVNGAKQANPHPIRSGNNPNGRILEVHCCAVTFGYSPMGIPQASARTTVFDTPAYKMVDFLAKAKKLPQAFMVLPADMKPDDVKDQDQKKKGPLETWTKYPYDEAMNLWLNTAHDEVITWLSQIVKREMKAYEFAQTFAARNSQKHYFGIQKAPCDNWRLPVIAWRPIGTNIIKWDSAQYSELQDRVSTMLDGDKNHEFEHKLQITQGTDRTSDDDDFEALESEVDPEDSQESGEQTAGKETSQQEEKPDKESTDEYPTEPTRDVKQAIYLAKNFPAEFGEACKLCKVVIPVNMFDDEIAVEVCKKVAELVDNQQ